MDDYVWLLVLFGLWVIEIVGKAIKRASGSNTSEETPDSSLRDPRVAKRRLTREVTESARRAEDALARWEQRQAEGAVAPPPPVPSRRRRAPVRRQSALEAIASMLVELPVQGEGPPQVVHESVPVPVAKGKQVPEHRRASETPPEEPLDAPVTFRRDYGGLQRLARLPELQRAIVLSEILGPPVSLAPPGDYGSA